MATAVSFIVNLNLLLLCSYKYIYNLVGTNGYDKANKVKDLSNWFTHILKAKLLRGFAPYYLNPTNLTLNGEKTSTIWSPDMNFRYPMLSFDYNTNIDMINDVLNASPSSYPHGKDVLTIITGLIGGKARIIEEIKMKINSKVNNILTVGVTLSIDWHYKENELNVFKDTLYPQLTGEDERRAVGVTFIVISRLIAMLYGKHIVDARDVYEDIISEMPKVDIADFHLVLVAFVKALVGEYNRLTGRSIDSFVLMLDGAHRPYESSYNCNVTGDLWGVVREAMLGSDMLTYTGLKTALVMSALPNKKLILTSPGQQSRSLVTPTVVDSAEVVSKSWLLRLDPALPPLTPTDIARLELVAATCAQRGELLRICGYYIFERINKGETIDSILSDNFLSQLASYHFRKFTYQDTPNNKQMHHILFQKPLQFDIYNHTDRNMNYEDVSRYLYCSYLTNTINSVSPESVIIPDASVIIMTFVVYRTNTGTNFDRDRSYTICYKEPLVNIFNYCLSPNQASTGKVEGGGGGGGLLQGIVLNIIKAKLSCDLRCIDIPTTIADLLSLQYDSNSIEDADVSKMHMLSFIHTYRLQSLLPKRVEFSDTGYRKPWCEPPPQVDYALVTLPRYERNRKGFYKVLTDPSHLPSAYTPYVFLLPPVSESHTAGQVDGTYDMVLICYAGLDEPPHIIFLSLGTTTQHMTPHMQADGKVTLIPQWVMQYRRTFAQLTKVDNLPVSKLPLSGLLKHIRDGKWMYVYMSSDPTHTRPIIIDNCLVLSAAEVSRFMGPFREVYKTAVRYVQKIGHG